MLFVLGTHRFGTFLHKGFVLVQDLIGVSFWYIQRGAGVSFWCMQRDRGVVLVHGRVFWYMNGGQGVVAQWCTMLGGNDFFIACM